MKYRLLVKSRQGSILILALWSLGLLTVFALSIGMRVQQKIVLVSRIERRTQVYDAAEAGIRQAIAFLKSQTADPKAILKTVLFNSPAFFKEIKLGKAVWDVSYMSYDGEDYSQRIYGIVDEERKININTCDRTTLENLLTEVSGLSDDARKDLVNAIIDWRESGESQSEGFLSDEYYGNLKFPYKEKKSNFETLDELLLVKGITPALYRQILSFITVYGSGKVNINTAPRPVLKALGISESLATAILFLRRGPDGREATADDLLFPSESEAPMMHILAAAVEPQETQFMRDLYAQNKIGMESSHYLVQSRGYANNMKEKRDLICVFDINSGKIKYWREY